MFTSLGSKTALRMPCPVASALHSLPFGPATEPPSLKIPTKRLKVPKSLPGRCLNAGLLISNRHFVCSREVKMSPAMLESFTWFGLITAPGLRQLRPLVLQRLFCPQASVLQCGTEDWTSVFPFLSKVTIQTLFQRFPLLDLACSPDLCRYLWNFRFCIMSMWLQFGSIGLENSVLGLVQRCAIILQRPLKGENRYGTAVFWKVWFGFQCVTQSMNGIYWTSTQKLGQIHASFEVSCFKLHKQCHASHDWTSQDISRHYIFTGTLRRLEMSVPTKNIKKRHPGFEPATKEYQRLLVCHDHCHITAYIARHVLLDGIQWAHHLIHLFAPLRQRSLVGTLASGPCGGPSRSSRKTTMVFNRSRIQGPQHPLWLSVLPATSPQQGNDQKWTTSTNSLECPKLSGHRLRQKMTKETTGLTMGVAPDRQLYSALELPDIRGF